MNVSGPGPSTACCYEAIVSAQSTQRVSGALEKGLGRVKPALGWGAGKGIIRGQQQNETWG